MYGDVGIAGWQKAREQGRDDNIYTTLEYTNPYISFIGRGAHEPPSAAHALLLVLMLVGFWLSILRLYLLCLHVQLLYGKECSTMPVKVMILWRSVCAQDKHKALVISTQSIQQTIN